MIVDLVSDERGNVVCVTSTRAESRTQGTALWRLAGERWQEVARWKGKMITAVAACGGYVVCAGLDGMLYGLDVERGQMSQAEVSVESGISAGVATGDGRMLFAGGQGVGLVAVEVPSLEVKRKLLGEYGVSRPGRTVHTMVRWGQRVLMAGAKNMVLVYENERIEELASKASFGGDEVLMASVAGVGSDVYVTGITGAKKWIFKRSGVVWEEVEPPTPARVNCEPGLLEFNGKLLVSDQAIYAQEGSGWRRWCDSFSVERVSAMAPIAGEAKVCVLSGDDDSFLVGEQGFVKLSGLKS